MGFKINVDRFGFAKQPKPEKVSRDYAAEYAKSLFEKEVADRMNEDAVLLGKITAEESARVAAIEQLQEETDLKLTAEVNERNTAISDAVTGEVVARNEAISNAISEEATARAKEDAVIGGRLNRLTDQERSARIAADDALGKRLDNALTEAITYTNDAVGQEEELRTKSDTELRLVTDALNERLDNVYTKDEVDGKIDSIDVDLSGYYTKQEIDYFNQQINDDVNAKADYPWVSSRFAGIDTKIETLDTKVIDIEKKIDEKCEFERIESGTLNENVNAIVPDLKGNRYKEIYCYLKIPSLPGANQNNKDGRIYITDSGATNTNRLWDQQNWLLPDFDKGYWEMSVHAKAFGELCSTKVWFYDYYGEPYAKTPVSGTFAGGEAPFKKLSRTYFANIGILISSKDGRRCFPSGTTFEIWGVRV